MPILYIEVRMGIISIKEDSKNFDNKVTSPIPLIELGFLLL